jgi:hypothetical protein
MSMSFENPVSDEAVEKMQEFFDVVAHDKKTFLINNTEINSRVGGEIARLTSQIATFEINGPGDTKVLSDGTCYELNKNGWNKV